MARVFAQMTRVQLVERRQTVFVLDEEIDEPTELSARILAVVTALATLAFALIVTDVG